MQLVIPRETQPGENRVSATPETVKKLVRLGADVVIEAGAGMGAGISDADYEAAGASIGSDRGALLAGADMVLRLRKPEVEEISQLKAGCIHVSYLDPFNEKDLIKAFAQQNVTAVSMEMIPRSTRSQKMDALSSQANLAGYVAVMLAANHMPRIMPMMMTPAGTLKPAKVFIIGAGVAGLQAIATAKRLGARVTAFDTRPVVAEQVQSLGAKFLEID
ncbi:MAG: NAD(P)(+) transhydrogenase (Re/Si-specific) subunit alpha, partial [Halieaceae bacterium]